MRTKKLHRQRLDFNPCRARVVKTMSIARYASRQSVVLVPNDGRADLLCSTTPEALYSWLWALVLGSRVFGCVSPLWRATAACELLRRTCPGELFGLSGADSGACQSRLGGVMHWRELSAS